MGDAGRQDDRLPPQSEREVPQRPAGEGGRREVDVRVADGADLRHVEAFRLQHGRPHRDARPADGHLQAEGSERRHLRQPHRRHPSDRRRHERLQDEADRLRAVQGRRVPARRPAGARGLRSVARRRAEDQARHRPHHPRRHHAHPGAAPRHGELRGQHHSVRERGGVREEPRLHGREEHAARSISTSPST